MTWGITPAGFVAKPFSAILADKQAAVLAALGNGVDLSPPSPMGQLLAAEANSEAELWELAAECYGQFIRQNAEGQSLDGLGDLVGIPREGESSTQVGCNLTISAADAPYAPGSLVAYVAGSPALTFYNVNAVLSGDISGGIATGILFQATTPGNTPSINPGTLTGISSPVTGWTAITNPATQSQLGANAELDSAYALRQEQEVTGQQGSCTSNATVTALYDLANGELPNIQTLAQRIAGFSANVLENDTNNPLTVDGVTLPPHIYAPVVYDPTGTLTAAAIGQVVYNNKPAGITSYGSLSVTITDPYLGQQAVFYSVPAVENLYVSATVAILSTFTWSGGSGVAAAIQTALAALAFGPGQNVVFSQLSAAIQAVPGVYDVQLLTFDFTPSPVNTGIRLVNALQVVKIPSGNVVLLQGSYP